MPLTIKNLVGLLLLLSVTVNVHARPPASSTDTVSVSLNEALEIALVNSYILQRTRLDVDIADQQVNEARGTVYPQVGAMTSYTRNIKIPNPFAGSDAEGLFASFAAIDWLFYNENRRQDGEPTIAFGDYLDQQRAGLEAAGIELRTGSNPFAVENQFILGVSASQALFNAAAFAAIRGAEQYRQVLRDQLENDSKNLVAEVKTAYLGALLAQEQVALLETSLQQLRETHRDISLMVDQGILSRFDRNSLSVEIVNLETSLITARNGADLAKRALNITLGMPVAQPIRLSDSFAAMSLTMPPVTVFDDAFQTASVNRSDLKLADGAVRLRKIEKELTRATFYPLVSAFADYAYIGSVPDYRTQSIADPDVPFTFTKNERSFFDTSYWNASFAVGVQLQWRIFTGFQTRARLRQIDLNLKQAEIDAHMLSEYVYLEVDAGLKNLRTAWQRIESQKRNIELAEMNYNDARSRLREGIGTRLEERQASSLLDQSRLNYLTAVHDYLIARTAYDKALGVQTVTVEITQ